ncbi:MAG: protein kinase domain-containing protein [Acidobacteriota bacterium]
MRQPVPFGKYLLLDRISVGGMAEVFKAKSYGVEGFEKIIAIKRILPTMGEDRDFIKMFIDEAKIAGQLAHANICQIFELGRIEGSHFIAMEYIWGKDLLQIQNRVRKLKQRIPVPMACFAISKVLEGLDYAHRKRDPLGRPLEIVHRDCSPQNVLVSYEGEVKVIDFGIAKATSRNSRTMAGVLKGKFGYMSPEQVRGLPLDRRSDIFALGTMLYECLTGERLFQGETDFSTLEKVRNVDVQPPRAVNPDIPEAVERVILKALAKDVDDRYQWCSEMLADLQQYLMSQDVVFTAKSLSSWLKETFAQEIERERQQLEAYKRVGRDGLIAGVPAAEAKLDVNEHLGEAGKPEGDATTLGGPNFDDIEAAAGAQPDVTGAAPPIVQKAAAKPADVEAGWDDPTTTNDDEDDDDGDFGEEAPTEIFGDEGQPVAAAGAQGRAASQPNKPPPKPIGRSTTQRPAEVPVPMAASPSGAAMRAPAGQMASMQPDPMGKTVPNPGFVPPPAAYPPGSPYGTPPGPQAAMQGPGSGAMAAQMPVQMPIGTPGSMPVDPSLGQGAGLAQPGAGPSKTVLGVAAPQGLGNYGGGYRPTPPGMNPVGQPMAGYPQASGGYPQNQGYPSPYGQPYPSSGPLTSPPVEPLAPVVEGKKSTLVRDIGIGVAIAALVLVGFLGVKMFVLDKKDDGGSQQPGSTIATIKISLTAGVTAELWVDDKKIASVSDGQSVPLTPGLRRVKLIGPNNARCEEPVKLEPGQTTTLECQMAVGAGSAGSAGAEATAPETGSASSAVVATGSNAVAQQDATKPADTKPADTKPTEDTKPSDKKPTGNHVGETKTTKNETKTTHLKTPVEPRPPEPKPDTKPAMADDPTKGYVQLASKPSAKIFIDGADTGKATPVRLPVSPGKHKVSFVVGDDRYTYPVTVKAGETVPMQKDLQ